MNEAHVYMCFQIASSKSTAGSKTRLFPSLFLISTSRFLILAEAFWNDHVAARSTAFRSAFEKNELGGYVTSKMCSSNITLRSSTANWLKF